MDPLDRFDPGSAAAAGVDLSRLLWLRGPRCAPEETGPETLADATAAVATLVGSLLFDVVALDLAGAEHERRRLPGTTWLRLQRLVEDTPTAVRARGRRPRGLRPGRRGARPRAGRAALVGAARPRAAARGARRAGAGGAPRACATADLAFAAL